MNGGKEKERAAKRILLRWLIVLLGDGWEGDGKGIQADGIGWMFLEM